MEKGRDWTAEEVAEVCRVHVATVRRWIVNGQVWAIRLPGGNYRIPQAEVERLRSVPTSQGQS